MMIGSIDIQNGQTVQLVGGVEHALDAGDPIPLARQFGRVGEVAVIDLDAAMGTGSNQALVQSVLSEARCRVGGGIRDEQAACRWLDAGAEKIILGTAAQPALLRKLPRQRVIAALDAVNDEVVVEGWKTRTGTSITERMRALEPYVGGFLVTFVEREGRLGGTRLDRAEQLRSCTDLPLTIAGGVTTADEIATLDSLGIDAQVGMALYTGRLGLAEAFAAPLVSDRPDGLWPTVVCDERGVSLGLCWSNLESLRASIETGTGVYWSRKRGLWHKGASSGNTQKLLDIAVDCDRDALRFTVRQAGSGFCHTGSRTCFGSDRGLAALQRTLRDRMLQAPEGSYTARLLREPGLLRAKLIEEAGELADAKTPDGVRWETADILYFALVAATRAGVSIGEVEAELDRRATQVTRRPGNAKEVRS